MYVSTSFWSHYRSVRAERTKIGPAINMYFQRDDESYDTIVLNLRNLDELRYLVMGLQKAITDLEDQGEEGEEF